MSEASLDWEIQIPRHSNNDIKRHLNVMIHYTLYWLLYWLNLVFRYILHFCHWLLIIVTKFGRIGSKNSKIWQLGLVCKINKWIRIRYEKFRKFVIICSLKALGLESIMVRLYRFKSLYGWWMTQIKIFGATTSLVDYWWYDNERWNLICWVINRNWIKCNKYCFHPHN